MRAYEETRVPLTLWKTRMKIACVISAYFARPRDADCQPYRDASRCQSDSTVVEAVSLLLRPSGTRLPTGVNEDSESIAARELEGRSMVQDAYTVTLKDPVRGGALVTAGPIWNDDRECTCCLFRYSMTSWSMQSMER